MVVGSGRPFRIGSAPLVDADSRKNVFTNFLSGIPSLASNRFELIRHGHELRCLKPTYSAEKLIFSAPAILQINHFVAENQA